MLGFMGIIQHLTKVCQLTNDTSTLSAKVRQNYPKVRRKFISPCTSSPRAASGAPDGDNSAPPKHSSVAVIDVRSVTRSPEVAAPAGLFFGLILVRILDLAMLGAEPRAQERVPHNTGRTDGCMVLNNI